MKRENLPQPTPLGLFHLLMHIGHLLESHCREGLKEYGLHHGQARVLMALDRSDGLIQARLAAGLDIAPATLSIMLKKLHSSGLVQRAADSRDERVNRIVLTPAGQKAVKRIRAVWQQAFETIVDSLDPRDRQLTHQLLLSIRNALGGRTPGL